MKSADHHQMRPPPPMTTKYGVSLLEPIQDDSQDGPRGQLRGKGSYAEEPPRHRRTRHSTATTPARANMGKERERSRRAQRSTPESKHSHKGKDAGAGRASGLSREIVSDRHHRTMSTRSDSTSSSEDEAEPIQDHRAVLAAARSRLTSPSMVSAFTSATASTNVSSGSSGSNSTVTQASTGKQSVAKRPEKPDKPISPAVPDAPDVFAYLEAEFSEEASDENEKEDSDEHEEEEGDEHEKEDSDENGEEDLNEHEKEGSDENGEEEESTTASEDEDDTHKSELQWPPHGTTYPPLTSIPPHVFPDTPSSGTSSFHGSEHFSETPADNDTDRSTSPERSAEEEEQASDHEAEQPSPASVKIASQLAAAQQRQSAHSQVQNFGPPNMPRGDARYPYAPTSSPSALHSQYQQHQYQPHQYQQHQYQQQHVKRIMPRTEETLPITGYELLASRLASHTTDSEDGHEGRIKPIYRKFEALNHRLLLHLQDEISELEEQLHRLDNADTQSRRAGRMVMPASRRAAQAAGGELQWHKTDILGRIGFKLAQYSTFPFSSPCDFLPLYPPPILSFPLGPRLLILTLDQALAAFNATASLAPPAPTDISLYREYLQSVHPIAEPETHFLDPADDLVSVCSSTTPSSLPSRPSVPSAPFPQTQTTTQPQTETITQPQTQPLTQSSPWAAGHRRRTTNDQNGAELTLTEFAMAIAAAVLVPIMTFSLIPGFAGRLTVTCLVATGVVGAFIQAGILMSEQLFEREGLVCGGIYLGAMVLVAGIMG